MAGIDGFGTQFARGDGATPTEVFTSLANVVNIEGPGLEREVIDVTAHDSPDQYREKRGGIKDGGEVSVEINYNPTVHDVLVSDLDDELPRNYKVIYPEGTVWAFAAVMKGFEPAAPHDDKLAATITFDVSGKPTITPGP